MNPTAADLRAAIDPAATFERAFGAVPFEWQRQYLRATGNVVLLKGRQIGASTASAALALHTAMYEAGALVVIVSPSQRQSQEIAAKARAALRNLDRLDLDADSATTLGLSNGSRILSLPGTATSIRGYSARLLIVDEAAFVDEETWLASQALVATGGRLLVMSTPAGKAGWFFDLWQSEAPGWTTFRVPTANVSTVSAEYLASARLAMGPWQFAMEFECEFGAGGASIFNEERLWGLVNDRIPPLFGSEL